MQLQLSPEEKEVLYTILRDYLSDLNSDVTDIEIGDFRSLLQHREGVVRKLIEQLREGHETAGEYVGI